MASSELPAENGHVIQLQQWRPDEAPVAVIQLLHGLGEHTGRYARFAADCNQKGMAVFAHDHRGHGGDAACRGHFADSQGWNRVIADVAAVNTAIRLQYPDTPIVLLGHSMGSYIAQSYAMRHPNDFSVLILSASTYASRLELRGGHLLATLLCVFGRRKTSSILNYAGFGSFNKSFKPARTEYDWLTRDESEVDKFRDDPLCGGPYSNQLWKDLTGGLLEITAPQSIAKIPVALPILILGGQLDPVGGQKGLTRLATAYRDTGHRDVTLTIYPDGRHEMLNETNHDEVTDDILGWILSRIT